MLVMEQEATKTLTRREAAAYAGVHYNTIRQWEARGLLHPQRIYVNNVEEVRIPLDELEAVMRDRPEPWRYPKISDPDTKALVARYEAENEGLREQVKLLREIIDEINKSTRFK